MPSLSHTQMEVWGQCPRKWALLYAEQVPAAPNEYFILGRAIHAAFEADGQRHIAGLPPLNTSEILEVFSERLAQEVMQRDPLGLLADRTGLLNVRGASIVNAYIQKVQRRYSPVSVEEQFHVPIAGLSRDLESQGQWEFAGIVDARTEPTTGPTIIDFKTSTKPWARGKELKGAQASAYLWAEHVARRQPRATRFTFIVFVSPESTHARGICEVDVRTTSRTQSQLETFGGTVRQVVADISNARKSGVYDPCPSPLCGWCTVLGHCSSGQKWLAERGRTPSVPVLRPDSYSAVANTLPATGPQPKVAT